MTPLYRRPKVRPFPVPRAVQLLPFNLLRSQGYPSFPGRVGKAIEAGKTYLETGRKPYYLPQRMMFQQWKTGGSVPDGQYRSWDSSATSFTRLFKPSGAMARVSRIPQLVSHYDMEKAARGHGLRLPQPTDYGRLPQLDDPVITRGLREPVYTRPPGISQYTQTVEAILHTHARDAGMSRQRALREVSGAITRLEAHAMNPVQRIL